MQDKVYIFDTTLRDGEQCPGASMNQNEKLEVARQLSRLNVDVIEAGFPYSSPGDFESVRQIAREIKGPSIAGLCRALKPDIACCADALKPCKNATIHTVIATSDIHLKHKLKKSRAEVLKLAVEAVRFAKTRSAMVEFSAEDASRSDPAYVAQVAAAVIDAGATVVNIPDTVGYAIPEDFARFVKTIIELTPNAHKARFSVHCHNDLGLAVANSLAAVMAGARQIEGAINGIGERAGNASIEEVAMAIKMRRDFFKLKTDINTKEIIRTSRMVSNITGMVVQPNKAIVGANAFAHESGIHQDGVLKNRQTYEIINPKAIGLSENIIKLGRRSGRHALKKRLEFLGVVMDEKKTEEVYKRFIELADRKKDIFDDDLLTLVIPQDKVNENAFSLKSLQVVTGTSVIPQCVITLEQKGRILEAVGKGTGPVDAVYNTLGEMMKAQYKLVSYTIQAVTRGTDAQADVTVVLEQKGQKVSAQGVHTDVLVASAQAYVAAVNKMRVIKGRKALIHGV